ncbi:MAG: dTDP-4-dehydrorhamnose 3,5-epimerase family protein [Flavobacteriales bacterium]|nr:dTDP-4-dehydrorhamnose 3,5-epimerase family protein [Leptospiraceae bacterium]MCB9336310.1 dTDP-4-dehydrorhamnose 3,5-epimerase family protein [Flavobacteriales bacterium]
MDIQSLEIQGCFLIKPKVIKDTRGTFVKTYHLGIYNQHKLFFNFTEEYFSYSYKNVFRGLHFQLPPYDHTKIVYCINGEVIDYLVDLRKKSSTFLKTQSIPLNHLESHVVYIPSGVAHGFYTLSDNAIMIYKVSTVYSQQHDAGILWSSIDIDIPDNNPILSDRDSKFPPLKDFNNPF